MGSRSAQPWCKKPYKSKTGNERLNRGEKEKGGVGGVHQEEKQLTWGRFQHAKRGKEREEKNYDRGKKIDSKSKREDASITRRNMGRGSKYDLMR